MGFTQSVRDNTFDFLFGKRHFYGDRFSLDELYTFLIDAGLPVTIHFKKEDNAVIERRSIDGKDICKFLAREISGEVDVYKVVDYLAESDVQNVYTLISELPGDRNLRIILHYSVPVPRTEMQTA